MRRIKVSELKLMALLPAAEVCLRTGLQPWQVHSARYRHGVKGPTPRGRYVTFSAEDVAQMMMLRTAGFSLRQIGSLKNCSFATVHWTLQQAEQYGFEKYPPRRLDDRAADRAKEEF